MWRVPAGFGAKSAATDAERFDAKGALTPLFDRFPPWRTSSLLITLINPGPYGERHSLFWSVAR